MGFTAIIPQVPNPLRCYKKYGYPRLATPAQCLQEGRQMQQPMPAIPELRKQKQEDSKFEDSLGYTKKSFLKMK